MEMLSERYGWTPKEMLDQDYSDILAYLEVIKAKNAVAKNEQIKRR